MAHAGSLKGTEKLEKALGEKVNGITVADTSCLCSGAAAMAIVDGLRDVIPASRHDGRLQGQTDRRSDAARFAWQRLHIPGHGAQVLGVRRSCCAELTSGSMVSTYFVVSPGLAPVGERSL